MKMVAKDIVEEHNGVYDCKWHIVSPEGFDLPEGLEYLKGGWKQGEKGTTCIYIPVLRISYIPLQVAILKVCGLLEIINGGVDVEFEQCTGKSEKKQFEALMGMDFFNLTIHACNLTFRNLVEMLDPNNSNVVHGINLSGNTFEDCDKNWDDLNEISQFVTNGDLPVDELDLTNCSFNASEKEFLKQKLIVGNLII